MRSIVFLLAIGAVGCGVSPTSGDWNYTDQTPTGCGSGAQYLRDSDGNFTLDNNGDGTFTVDPRDGGEIFDCTLDGSSYECPERLSRTYDLDDLGAGLQGTASLRVSIEGEFDSDEDATGTQTGRLECEGSGCAVAAGQLGTSFPCSVTVDFQASLSSAN
jgi:hypothetical protein